MMISPYIRDRIMQTSSATETPVLRDGQIVEGKILKIHPNNRAEIQIGSHKMIAEVTTPLSVGRQYHFQVQTQDNVVQLKVIGEHLKQDPKVNTAQLLQQLSLKATRANVDLLQQLMQDRIPFNQSQLLQATQVLDKAPIKSEAIQIIKEMLQTRMPITNNVFQALLATRQEGITSVLQQLQATIQANPKATAKEQGLLQTIQQLLQQPVALEQKLTNELVRRDSPLTSLLQLAGHIPARANVQQAVVNQLVNMQAEASTKHSQMNNQENQAVNRQLLSSDTNTLSVQETNVKAQVRIPTFEQLMLALFNDQQLTEKSPRSRYTAIQETMQHMLNNQVPIQTRANQILNVFQGLQNGAVTEEQFALTRHMVQEQLFPHVQTAMQERIEPLLANPTKENQQTLAQHLQNLSRPETFDIIRLVTRETAEDKAWQQLPIQKQFISHVSQFMQSLGVKDEYMLKQSIQQAFDQGMPINNNRADAESMKSMLIQLSNSQNTIGAERIQHMLHFINGMQLQSVQESNQFVHAAMQVPGEKLGLNEDIYMQFEGQKTEDDTIDPDYCRILFVLHLENIDETIIDMHVQKRIITITIFNENDQLKPMMKMLEKPLKSKLNKMDYQVSSISLKPLYEQQKEREEKAVEESLTSGEERFDFRI